MVLSYFRLGDAGQRDLVTGWLSTWWTDRHVEVCHVCCISLPFVVQRFLLYLVLIYPLLSCLILSCVTLSCPMSLYPAHVFVSNHIFSLPFISYLILCHPIFYVSLHYPNQLKVETGTGKNLVKPKRKPWHSVSSRNL